MRKKVLTMTEYIERKALRDTLYDADAITMSGVKILNQFPGADVAPVRHGRWVDNHCTACGMMPMGDEMWKLCDFEPPRFEKFMDYCPNCGAKMDGGAGNGC